MKILLLFFTVVLMSPLFSGEIIVEKITPEEWQIRLLKDSTTKQCAKTLCIGNSKFQIKIPIVDTCKFVLKKQNVLINGKQFLSLTIKLGTVEGVFLLPFDNQYFIVEKMIVHPKKRNVWVSNIAPQTKVYTSFCGNSMTKDAKTYFIYVWDDNSSRNYETYFQSKNDALKFGNAIKKCNNLKDFIEYEGIIYLSPFISKEDLSLCNNCKSCYDNLYMLQHDLSWEVLSFNQGISGVDAVLMCCKHLFDFYLQHTDNKILKKNLEKKIDKLNLMIQQQNILKFKNGERN